MTTQHKNLPQNPNSPNKITTKNIAANLIDSVFNHMQAEICQGVIMIPKHQTQLALERKNKTVQNQSNKHKLAEVMQKKQQVLRQLQMIKQEQEQLKCSKVIQSRITSSNNYYKSSFTNQDIQTIRKIKADQKKFQKMLAEKTRQYEQRMKHVKQEQQQAKQQGRKQKYELKKQQMQKTIELIERRKKQRSLKIQQQSKAIKYIINRKKLHEVLQQKWKEVEQEQQKKIQKIKDEIKKVKKVNYDEIKEHEKKYQDTIRLQRQSRMKLSVSDSSQNYNPYRSAFLQHIKQEQRKNKQADQIRKKQPKQFWNRLKQYGDKVKTYHRPSVKTKQETQDIQKPKSPQMRSMSVFQKYVKGTQYMRAANMQIALKKRDQNIKKPQQAPQSPKYKNYLQQLKKFHPQHSKKGNELSEIRQILKKENLSQQQKLYLAKMLTQKIQHTKVVKTSQSIVNSINVKIQMLKQINI